MLAGVREQVNTGIGQRRTQGARASGLDACALVELREALRGFPDIDTTSETGFTTLHDDLATSRHPSEATRVERDPRVGSSPAGSNLARPMRRNVLSS